MNSGLWQVGASNGERKPFWRKTSNISGKMWCTHLEFGNEDKQHKDAAAHGRWLHQGTCSSRCSSPLLSVAREDGVRIMLTAVTGWFGTWYLLFRRCQHLVSDHGHVGIVCTSFSVGDCDDTYFSPCLFTCDNYLVTIEFKLGNVTDWKVTAPKDISP